MPEMNSEKGGSGKEDGSYVDGGSAQSEVNVTSSTKRMEYPEPGRKTDYGSIVTGWIMMIIASSLFIISIGIFFLGLNDVFPGKRFPADTDTPCMLAFLVLGLIFLNLGIVYRDMALYPEYFEQEIRKKELMGGKKEEWERIKRQVKTREKEMKRITTLKVEGSNEQTIDDGVATTNETENNR